MTEQQRQLKYCSNGVLREEIAYTVGVDPTRYGDGVQSGFLKEHLQQIAIALEPDDSEITIERCKLGPLYRIICDWAGGEYQPNSGNVWKINRENLKEIHRALDAKQPRKITDV